MNFAHLESIEQSPFLSCLSDPTDEQMATLVASLTESDSHQPPWADDPQAWVGQRLALPDWYSDLEDPVPWEMAITQLIGRPEFSREYSDGERTLLPSVVDWSRQAFELLGEPAVLRRFKPYRYFLSEDRELELACWPHHALLANDDVGRLLSELARFEALLETLEQDDPGFLDACRRQIDASRESVAICLPLLDEIHARGRMLYAPFEM